MLSDVGEAERSACASRSQPPSSSVPSASANGGGASLDVYPYSGSVETALDAQDDRPSFSFSPVPTGAGGSAGGGSGPNARGSACTARDVGARSARSVHEKERSARVRRGARERRRAGRTHRNGNAPWCGAGAGAGGREQRRWREEAGRGSRR